MLFSIFLISILVLEGILRHDEAKERKIKRLPISQPAPLVSDPNSTDVCNVLTLAKAIERHSHDAQRPLTPSPVSLDYTLEPPVTPVAPIGSGQLK